MTTAELAVGALRAAIEETDYRAVLDAFNEIRAEREADLEEARIEYERAERRVDMAASNADMRTWTQEERWEYEDAQMAAIEAWANYKRAKEAL